MSDYNTQQYNKIWDEVNIEIDKLQKRYRVLHTITKEEADRLPRAKEGDVYPKNPIIPDNPIEAFELFKNYYAQISALVQRTVFIEKYKVWNRASVEAEIAVIEKWIEEVKKLDYTEAVSGVNKHLQQYEYLRLANGYYEGYKMTWQEHQETSTAASVYGRYFIFYEYLKEMLDKFYMPSSKYLHLIDINFEDLPRYVIERGIVARFENLALRKDEEYNNWFNNWAQFINTIPNEHRLKAMQKGIEYASKVYKYHLEKECEKPDNCRYNESWERRIAIAQNALDKTLATDKENDKVEQQAQETNGNPEFTLSRQVLAIHYLLKQSGIDNIDKTNIARFVQFLTNREVNAKSISDTRIYKTVRNPFSTSNKTLIADLQFVRKQFEDLQMPEITQLITKEIDAITK